MTVFYMCVGVLGLCGCVAAYAWWAIQPDNAADMDNWDHV